MWLVISLSLAVGACRTKPHSPAPDAGAAPATPGQTLVAVWGSGDTNVWAAGPHGQLEHFDGRSWQVVPSGTTEDLKALAGSAADDIWAVGTNGVTLHFDGHAWKPTGSNTESTLLNVLSKNRGDVWVSGVGTQSGFVQHYQGAPKWENLDVSDAASLWRSWAAGPQDIWFVGADRDMKGFVLRGDGKHFDRVPFEGSGLRGVVGTSASDVWVAEYAGGIHHWDGAKWTFTAVPNVHWLGLWASNAHDVWAFGLDGVLSHFDGKTWSRIDSGTQAHLWSAWGSAANSVWIVGSDGVRLHWDGSALQKR